QRMVRDLDFGVERDVAPTVREADGLAMSSRNVYLSVAERKQAVVLARALQAGFRAWSEGERKSAVVRALMMNVLAEEPAARLDYLEIVSQRTLEPVALVRSGTLVAGAIRVGKTRLIDNWWVREDGEAEF
ncbi:MAG TPA: pantoate--beta-alanine ligase, partial [Candidatus Latescibacteria bacterium]|nr:pantoate--beta-alanine ligase [Candidatus Latescibacterota bacterium]